MKVFSYLSKSSASSVRHLWSFGPFLLISSQQLKIHPAISVSSLLRNGVRAVMPSTLQTPAAAAELPLTVPTPVKLSFNSWCQQGGVFYDDQHDNESCSLMSVVYPCLCPATRGKFCLFAAVGIAHKKWGCQCFTSSRIIFCMCVPLCGCYFILFFVSLSLGMLLYAIREIVQNEKFKGPSIIVEIFGLWSSNIPRGN